MNESELKHLTALANQENAEAQNSLGVYYATTTRNNKLALKWYLKSACAGHAEALWNAGSMLVDGEDGIEKDTALGLLLVRLSADAFQTSACLYLSMCYEQGKFGFPMNDELAEFWGRMAYSPEKFMGRTQSIELDLFRKNIALDKYLNV